MKIQEREKKFPNSGAEEKEGEALLDKSRGLKSSLVSGLNHRFGVKLLQTVVPETERRRLQTMLGVRLRLCLS